MSDPDDVAVAVAVGDVVQLKSGGPPMVIVALDETWQTIEVEWFDHSATMHTRHFSPECLQTYDANNDHTRDGTWPQQPS